MIDWIEAEGTQSGGGEGDEVVVVAVALRRVVDLDRVATPYRPAAAPAHRLL